MRESRDAGTGGARGSPDVRLPPQVGEQRRRVALDLEDERLPPGQQLAHRRLEHPAASSDDRDVVGDALHVLEDVGGVADGGRAPQPLQDPDHLEATGRVERGARFVEQQHLGVPHQGLGDAEALAHATGVAAHLARGGVGEVDQARRSSARRSISAASRSKKRPVNRRVSLPVIQP